MKGRVAFKNISLTIVSDPTPVRYGGNNSLLERISDGFKNQMKRLGA